MVEMAKLPLSVTVPAPLSRLLPLPLAAYRLIATFSASSPLYPNAGGDREDHCRQSDHDHNDDEPFNEIKAAAVATRRMGFHFV